MIPEKIPKVPFIVLTIKEEYTRKDSNKTDHLALKQQNGILTTVTHSHTKRNWRRSAEVQPQN